MDTKPGENMSRRSFLKASAITIVAATATDALAASAPRIPATREPVAKTAAEASP